MKIISIASLKGGVGKTTITAYLAQALTLLGKKVLIIDLDQNNNLTDFGLRFHKEKDSKLGVQNIFSVLLGKIPIESAIWKSQHDGIDIIPTTKDFRRLEKELGDDPGVTFRFQKDLRGLKYDFILLDLHPAINLGLRMALYSSDLVLCPVEYDTWNSHAIDDIKDEVLKANYALGSKIAFAIVRTNVNEAKSEELKFVADSKNVKALKTTIYKNEAISTGTDLAKLLGKETKALEFFKQLAMEVINETKRAA